jgi:hypothetical protein
LGLCSEPPPFSALEEKPLGCLDPLRLDVEV